MKRHAITVGAAMALLAAPTAAAQPVSPCHNFEAAAIGHAIDYGLERSTEGDLQYALNLDVDIVIENCRRSSERRVRFDYSLVVRDETSPVIEESGKMVVTRARVTFQPEGDR